MAKKIDLTTVNPDTLKAAHEFLKLQNREQHPQGDFDNAGRFYLENRHECCRGIRTPSRRWPYSQMVHGRTAQHVAGDHGVEATELRRVANAIKKAAK